MSRVIQLLSHNQHLFALTDNGEIFVLRSECLSGWLPVEGPLLPPPRFSHPEEYAPATEPEDSPDFNSLNGAGQGVYRNRVRPPARRPTSIGPDGNYVPVVDHRHYLD